MANLSGMGKVNREVRHSLVLEEATREVKAGCRQRELIVPRFKLVLVSPLLEFTVGIG